ncbi:cyclin [Cytidiella melzeri]|nr:cyclin [Cytidiella melzeri]
MKDVSNSVTKASRLLAYPKKRPSPHGVSKSRKQSTSPLHPAQAVVRRSPRTTKAEEVQRQREAQIHAMRRQGIFLEEEYQDEIKFYMHEMERFTMPSLTSMDQQPEIRWHMRPCLVDFLVEVHFSFRLRPETLYLALNIIDRYVSRRIVYVKHYQLVGCAALWIAAKFEDAKDRVPTVSHLAEICREAYDESAFIQMEGHVLATIQWSLGHPTAEAWLRILCCGPCVEDPKVQHVARFLMEITLFYREFVEYVPSTIALGALTLARYICGKGRRLFAETDEGLEIVELLDNRLAKHVNELSETLVKKYAYAFYSKAATFVLQYYLQGNRFERRALAPLPMTPVKTKSSKVYTPASVSTTASDISDDMPATPTSPMMPSDAFSSSYMSDDEDDKENFPSSPTFSPVVSKQHSDPVPEQFLPHDYVSMSRPALHSLNAPSPRVMPVS